MEPFANTDVYNLICDTLDIVPAPNNGSLPHEIWSQKLPDEWKDDLTFPNLPFQVEHIVRTNATYDLLWRKGDEAKIDPAPAPTNKHPVESMKSEESTITSLETESLPKPSDFISSSTGTTMETLTTTKAHEGFGKIVGDIIGGIEDGFDAIGGVVHDFIDDIFN